MTGKSQVIFKPSSSSGGVDKSGRSDSTITRRPGPAGGEYVTEQIGDKTFTYFVPEGTKVYKGSLSGGHGVPAGAKLVVDTTTQPITNARGEQVGTVKSTPTPPAAQAEREQLLKNAAMNGQKLSATQQKELLAAVAREQERARAQYEADNSQKTIKYGNTLVTEISVSKGFAELYNEKVLQQSRYVDDNPVLNVRLELGDVPINYTNQSKAPYTVKSQKNTELSERGKAVVKALEYSAELDQKAAERQAKFQRNVRYGSSYLFGDKAGAYVEAGVNLGYGASIGFGEALSSAAVKTYAFTGALITPELREGAKNELFGKDTANRFKSTVKEQFDLRTAKGQVNTLAFGLAVFAKAQSIKAARQAKSLKVEGEKLPSNDVLKKFAREDSRIAKGQIKEGEVSRVEFTTRPRGSDTSYSSKTGDTYTQIDNAKPALTGKDTILTEQTRITVPREGATVTQGRSIDLGAKYQYDLLGVDNFQAVQTTLRGDSSFNYIRLTLGESGGKGVNLYFKQPIAREGIRGTTQPALEYLGATKATVKPYTLISRTKSEVKIPFSKEGTTAGTGSTKTTVETMFAKENPYFRGAVETKEIGGTIVSSKSSEFVTRNPSGGVKTPYAGSGAKVTDLFSKGQVSMEGLEKPIFQFTKGESTPQAQLVVVDTQGSAVQTITPYVAEIKSESTYIQVGRFGFVGKKGHAPAAPLSNLRLKSAQVQEPKLVFNTPSAKISIPSTQTPTPRASVYGFVISESDYKTVSEPSSESNLTNTPTLITITDLGLKDRNRSIYLPGEKEQNKPDTELGLRQGGDQGTGDRSGTGTSPFTGSRSVQDQRQEQEQQQQQISKQEVEQIYKPRETNYSFKWPKTGSPPKGITPIPLPFKEMSGASNSGFIVLLRRRGKFVLADSGIYTQEQALALGSYKAETSSAATFKIVKVARPVNKRYTGPAGSLANYYSKGGVFIEKAAKRINTPGEVQEIPFKAAIVKSFTTKKGGALKLNKRSKSPFSSSDKKAKKIYGGR